MLLDVRPALPQRYLRRLDGNLRAAAEKQSL